MGDEVEMELEDKTSGTAIITAIHDRRNYINRQSPRHKHQHHIVAANLDQTILVATLREPRTSRGFIDRFLVAAEMYHVPAVVVFNKSDLYRRKEEELYEAWKEMYEQVGYRTLLSSTVTGVGMEELAQILQNKRSLFSGHSGVGKSLLSCARVISLADPANCIETGKPKQFFFKEAFEIPSAAIRFPKTRIPMPPTRMEEIILRTSCSW